MSLISEIERRRKLDKMVRGRRAGRTSGRAPSMRKGPSFEGLDLAQRVELQRYAKEAGRDWRTDLLADCIRGGSRRAAKFSEVLCPMIRMHGAKWFRHELQVPWEGR